MSQRDSGYERKELDCYETPEWVTDALLPHIPAYVEGVWEPACGSGKMVRALGKKFKSVLGTDITSGHDFLKDKKLDGWDAIITNPPYADARAFIEHALELTSGDGFIGMLLRTDYDHASSRKHLFAHWPFHKKLVLTKRIKWFEDSKGQPSFNHAWFMWDWQQDGPPTIAYH